MLHRPRVVGVYLDLGIFEVRWVVDHVQNKTRVSSPVSINPNMSQKAYIRVNMDHCKKSWKTPATDSTQSPALYTDH
jgi:hypothetical protein